MIDFNHVSSEQVTLPHSHQPKKVIEINKKEAAVLAVIQLLMLLHTKILNVESSIGKIQSNLTDDMTNVMQEFAREAQVEQAKRIKLQNSIDSKNKILGTLGLIIGIASIVIGGALGSITAAIMSAAIMGISEMKNNPIDELATGIAKEIAPNNPNAQAWISGLVKLAIVVAVSGVGSKFAAMGDSMIASVAKKATTATVESVDTTVVARNMLLTQTLMVANPFSDIVSALLENCGVSKDKSKLIGGIIASFINLIIMIKSGKAMMDDPAVSAMSKSPKILLFSKLGLMSTSALMLISSGFELSKSLNEFNLADVQKKYGDLLALKGISSTTNDNIMSVLQTTANDASNFSKLYSTLNRELAGVVGIVQQAVIENLK